jgi:hypothetical protein
LAFSNVIRKLEAFTFDFSDAIRKLGGVNVNFAQSSMTNFREAGDSQAELANWAQLWRGMTSFIRLADADFSLGRCPAFCSV